MDEAHEKGRSTRQRNLAAQALRYEERAQAIKTARLALQRVMENESATPEQILRAAELLVEISK